MKNPVDDFNASRRALLRSGIAVAAVGVAATSGLLKVTPAMAQEAKKASQAVAMYQATPHGADQCDNCIHYIAGKTPKSDGTCKIVEGNIAPQGWCVLYARKA